MIKGIVKTNKANATKYIYLSKDCGFIDGQEVDIKNSGIGIYNKENLDKYFKDNKDMFIEIKKSMKAIRKKIWTDTFFEMGEIIGEVMDYGKLEWDEELYFEKNNEYSTCPEGDTDGGKFCNFDYNIKSFKETIKRDKLNPNQIKKELIDFVFINFLQRQAEKFIEQQHKEEVEMMKTLGFENKEDSRYWGMETTLYSNGLVQLYYDAESFVDNQELTITTMNEVKSDSKEPSITV